LLHHRTVIKWRWCSARISALPPICNILGSWRFHHSSRQVKNAYTVCSNR
jgi:hypothetical protein